MSQQFDQYGIAEPDNFDLQLWFDKQFSAFHQLDGHPRVLLPKNLPFVGEPAHDEYDGGVEIPCTLEKIAIFDDSVFLYYGFNVDNLIVAHSVLAAGRYEYSNEDKDLGSLNVAAYACDGKLSAIGMFSIKIGTVKAGIGRCNLLNTVNGMLKNNSVPDCFRSVFICKE